MPKNTTNNDGEDHHDTIATNMPDNNNNDFDGSISTTKSKHFPTAIHSMLNEAYETKNPAIEWIQEGAAFIVHPSNPELAALILKYFEHSKYQSLQRQLNMYGWKKHVTGIYLGAFHHPHYHIKKPNLSLITRRSPPSRQGQQDQGQGQGQGTVPETATIKKKAPQRKTSRRSKAATKTKQQPAEPEPEPEMSRATKTKQQPAEPEPEMSRATKTKQQPAEPEPEPEQEMSSKASLTSNEHDDDNEQIDDDNHSQASTQEEDVDLPLANYQVKQKVLARDADGLLYEAWIRRCLYGPHHHKQAQIGMFSDNNHTEMEDYWQRHSQPTWHYFVHYSKWKVNWDRWVSQDDILELTPENVDLSASISQEHRALQKEFKAKRSNKGKVGDGGAFLRAWKKRLQAMQEERTGNDNTTTTNNKTAAAKRRQAANGAWTKAALEKERKLRQHDLTTNKNVGVAEKQKIVLPFSLKRVLVEEWEVISQCHMVHSLPAPVTIRQALEQYAESKGIIQIQQSKSSSVMEMEMETPKEKADNTKPMDVEESESKEPTKEPTEGQESVEDEETKARNKEWTDMVDGIILLFNQALPFRLLYPQELIQHAAVEADDELRERSKADLYGCEHLLRLTLRLADIVAQDMDEGESKPLLAKVNDLVRFLHKHQSTLFTQSYRKLNEAELQQKLKSEKMKERKRKKLAEQQGALKKSKTNEEEDEIEVD